MNINSFRSLVDNVDIAVESIKETAKGKFTTSKRSTTDPV